MERHRDLRRRLHGDGVERSDAVGNGLQLTLAPGVDLGEPDRDADRRLGLRAVRDRDPDARQRHRLHARHADRRRRGTIADNEPRAQISVADATVTETNGTQVLAIQVTLAAPFTQTVTVTATTVQGSALAGKDYKTTTTTLTFAPGVTTVSFNVQILGDVIGEPTETFTVSLTNPSANAVLVRSSATVTIIDNDPMIVAPTGTLQTLSIDGADIVAASGLRAYSASAGASRTISLPLLRLSPIRWAVSCPRGAGSPGVSVGTRRKPGGVGPARPCGSPDRRCLRA